MIKGALLLLLEVLETQLSPLATLDLEQVLLGMLLEHQRLALETVPLMYQVPDLKMICLLVIHLDQESKGHQEELL